MRALKTSIALTCVFFVSCSPNLSQRYWEQADQHLRQGQYDQAVLELQRVVASKEDPMLVLRAQRQIAIIYQEYLKDYAKSVKSFREVYKGASDRDLKLQSRLSIARIYKNNLGNAQIASEEYQAIFEEFGTKAKEGPQILLEWAESLNEIGAGERAWQAYGEFLRLFPGHEDAPKILIRQGQSLINGKKLPEAISHFQKLIEQYQSNANLKVALSESYFGLGLAYEMDGQVDPAVEAFQKAKTDYPNPQVIDIKVERLVHRKKMRKQ